MGYSPQDAQAIAETAQRLGLDPAELGGLFELESGGDPNIWGGAGGKYRGLIQFGPEAAQKVGLPDGEMTVQQQLPYVERYFQQRGFKPGEHDITAAYRTVLVGNPFQSGTDSWGTNSDKAAARMRPGGDLYQRAKSKLGGVTGGGATPGYASGAAPGGQATGGTGARSDPWEGYEPPSAGAPIESLATGPSAGLRTAAGGIAIPDLPALAQVPAVDRRGGGESLEAATQLMQGMTPAAPQQQDLSPTRSIVDAKQLSQQLLSQAGRLQPRRLRLP